MLSSGLVLTWLSRVGCSAHQTDSWPERAVCQWGHLGLRTGAVGSCAQAPDGTESSQAKREAGSKKDLRIANVVRGSHHVQKGLENSRETGYSGRAEDLCGVTGLMSSVLRGFSGSFRKEPNPVPSAQLKQAKHVTWPPPGSDPQKAWRTSASWRNGKLGGKQIGLW